MTLSVKSSQDSILKNVPLSVVIWWKIYDQVKKAGQPSINQIQNNCYDRIKKRPVKTITLLTKNEKPNTSLAFFRLVTRQCFHSILLHGDFIMKRPFRFPKRVSDRVVVCQMTHFRVCHHSSALKHTEAQSVPPFKQSSFKCSAPNMAKISRWVPWTGQ